MEKVHVIGAGLAGSEAAYQLVKRGIGVVMHEMRPLKMTPAHQTGHFAELVCSNSFRSNSEENAVGLLKKEMEYLDSLIIKQAYLNQVPAGSALAVDRLAFSSGVEVCLRNHPLIEIRTEEVVSIPNEPTIIATGPLTSPDFLQAIASFCGNEFFHFYDAVAPIVLASSIDFSKAYWKSRYDKGEAAYINCPLTEEEFHAFYDFLIHAQQNLPHDFEYQVFEGCMAVEEMAKRGEKTLLFGPMKPVGLEHPETKVRPYAVVQLRQDDFSKSMFNVVGFQTQLKWPEQKKLLQMVPGLTNCEIVRYGVMHQNTYLDSPHILYSTYQTKKRADLFFAGQITGVEGYIESAASGMMAGINMAKLLTSEPLVTFSKQTGLGTLAHYISSPNTNFVPMNVNFGLFEELSGRIRKQDRKKLYKERSLNELERMKERL
ncbi:MAG: methylenetetrahydrofolate--tRNA-(uracil(54)-C(5))-methyltransferase (FADH(2)-oxidizing) TrmFO [Bacilli bacterium]|jgi:methylenetetrahydrofolate--tRNA-(uracil-5-)-methyltransferase|nr:methylenetetrahydrofolate--tRNA-(uracil(54)-C(5))-methyltransferase (FADH(2)-oxidizing) TrmFO [Bacilli bacterium]MDY0063966.1 methylenetetrahydrofolate--tRNA-(uracil(54)-C(5))-methyltransferase (FADH(2)-oxidizing) TrmFO [Bacilli bacterium]